MRAALGEMLAGDGVAALSAAAVGALVVLARESVRCDSLYRGEAAIGIDAARAVLVMRGLAAPAEADSMIQALSFSGFVSADDKAVRVPAVGRAAVDEMRSFSNRRAGWEKRAGAAGRQDGGAAGTPASVKLSSARQPEMAAGEQDFSQRGIQGVAEFREQPPAQRERVGRGAAADAVAADRAGSKEPAYADKVIDGVTHRRFGAVAAGVRLDAGALDDVVARIPCGPRAVALITRAYAEELAQAFPGLDVEQQLRRAAAWCHANPARQKTLAGVRRFINTWLSNASRDLEVRNAVVRGATARNGFGQGGAYRESSAGTGGASKEPSQGGGAADDFSDLTGPGPATLTSTQRAQSPEIASPSAVLAARAARARQPVRFSRGTR